MKRDEVLRKALVAEAHALAVPEQAGVTGFTSDWCTLQFSQPMKLNFTMIEYMLGLLQMQIERTAGEIRDLCMILNLTPEEAEQCPMPFT